MNDSNFQEGNVNACCGTIKLKLYANEQCCSTATTNGSQWRFELRDTLVNSLQNVKINFTGSDFTYIFLFVCLFLPTYSKFDIDFFCSWYIMQFITNAECFIFCNPVECSFFSIKKTDWLSLEWLVLPLIKVGCFQMLCPV